MLWIFLPLVAILYWLHPIELSLLASLLVGAILGCIVGSLWDKSPPESIRDDVSSTLGFLLGPLVAGVTYYLVM